MENEGNKEETPKEKIEQTSHHPSHSQIYSIVTSKDPSWQSIIYDLISSEQLDPWNIDIGILCRAYFGKIQQLEQNNFHISSKMLLAAALLLRIKSEILLNKYIRDIDNILFPRAEEEKKLFERIEIDENEIPILSPKTPLPRFKKVTIQELIDALDVAIKTESRRINKEIEKRQAERLSHVDIPKFRKINIRERIRRFYAKVLSSFKNPQYASAMKLPYSHFTGDNKDEKIACFLPMLYLSNHGKVWLEQDRHYDEIYLYLYGTFKKNFPDYDRHLIDSPENLEEIPESMLENYEEGVEEEVESEESAAIEKMNSELEEKPADSDE